ncbi:MAG TPA: protein kinase [Saprospiraceae bacterium]|nr:protein kinase [Saprospiraceae bacterium]
MNTVEWKRIKELFNEAISLAEPHRFNHIQSIKDEDPKVIDEVIKMLEADATLDTIVDKFHDDVHTILHNLQYEHKLPEYIGSYKIVEEAGRGGMGVVYKAYDALLERTLAIKLLPPLDPLTAKLTGNSLIEEAKAASKLDHPHIVTIYEVNQYSEGGVYIAMAYYEGTTLQEKIQKGTIDPHLIKKYFYQTLQALSAAHNAGITHGDIKPGNIMITKDDQVKILDFGVARIQQNKNYTQHNAGTIAYMSPERIAGGSSSKSSDIWSLGATFFEGITGRKYNPAKSLSEAFDFFESSMNDRVSDWKKVDSDIESILRKCLHTNVDLRYKDAVELLDHYENQMSRKKRINETWKSGVVVSILTLIILYYFLFLYHTDTSQDEVVSVLVLPFKNASNNKELDFITDGLSEDIITNLIQIEGIDVPSRISNLNVSIWENLPKLYDQFNTDYMLSADLLEYDNQLLIQARWTSVKDNKIIWEDQFQYSVTGRHEMQNHIIEALLREDRVKAGSYIGLISNKVESNNPETYTMFLKARYLLHKRKSGNLDLSIDWYIQCIEADPEFAMAWVGLGQAYIFKYWLTGSFPKVVFPKAKEYILHAISLDSTLAEAYSTLALILWQFDMDFENSEKAFQRSIQLYPKDITAYNWYGEFLICNGKYQEGLTMLNHALSLDPLSLITMTDIGFAYFVIGDYEKALEYFHMALDIEPDFLHAKMFMALVLTSQGKFNESASIYESIGDIFELNYIWQCFVAINYALQGNLMLAMNILDRLEEKEKDHFVSPVSLSFLYLVLGDEEKSLSLLNDAIELKDPMLIYIKTHPYLDALRGNTPFDEIINTFY